MLIFITGGSKCGKSSFAEKYIEEHSSIETRRLYIATMKPFGKDAMEAINRHRIMRKGKCFDTVEQYIDIENTKIDNYSVALLECVGNLCANEMFKEQYCNDVVDKIVSGIMELSEKLENLVVVSNVVGEDCNSYSKETLDYIRNIGEINTRLSRIADESYEVVYGIPVIIKMEE